MLVPLTNLSKALKAPGRTEFTGTQLEVMLIVPSGQTVIQFPSTSLTRVDAQNMHH